MTDNQILAEIVRRIEEHLAQPGWSEEGHGLSVVLDWIKELEAE